MLYSFSRLKKHEECPAWWFRSYVLEQKDPPTEALEVGRAVHRAIEILANQHMSLGGVDIDSIDSAVDLAVSEASLPVDREEVRRLVDQPGVMDCLGLPVEEHFQVSLNGVELQGYIDLWYSNGESPVVVDWKTAHQVYKPTDNHQLGLYASAVAQKIRQAQGYTPEEVVGRLVFLRHGCRTEEHVYTPEDMEAALDWAANIAAEIEEKLLEHALGGDPKNLFPAVPSDTCRYCPWASGCIEASGHPFRMPETISTRAEAEALAARCIQFEEALEQMKKTLKAWVEANGPVVVGSQSYELRPTVYWRFTPEALKKAIETIKRQGKDPLRYLVIDSYNIRRLGWEEKDLLGLGAAGKTYHSLRRVKAGEES